MGDGLSAIDTVGWAVTEMETCRLYVAGRGSAPNDQGVVECDSAIMDGLSGKAGGVCALQNIANPVHAARLVLDETPFVLFAGNGARRFALANGCAAVEEAEAHYRLPLGVEEKELSHLDPGLQHGTVGAVALDRDGRLAAATSTGGLLVKQAGRVGDTPITGIGNWADSNIAISCIGIGESFIHAGGARNVMARMAAIEASSRSIGLDDALCRSTPRASNEPF